MVTSYALSSSVHVDGNAKLQSIRYAYVIIRATKYWSTMFLFGVVFITSLTAFVGNVLLFTTQSLKHNLSVVYMDIMPTGVLVILPLVQFSFFFKLHSKVGFAAGIGERGTWSVCPQGYPGSRIIYRFACKQSIPQGYRLKEGDPVFDIFHVKGG